MLKGHIDNISPSLSIKLKFIIWDKYMATLMLFALLWKKIALLRKKIHAWLSADNFSDYKYTKIFKQWIILRQLCAVAKMIGSVIAIL